MLEFSLECVDLSQAQIREICQFLRLRAFVVKLLFRQKIAVFLPFESGEKSRLGTGKSFAEGLILLGFLQGADQADHWATTGPLGDDHWAIWGGPRQM